jgi:hypothetical protein
MKAILLVVGVIGLGLGCWFIYQYMYEMSGGRNPLIYGGVALGVALVCFAIFFFKRFREEGEQDISITKF